MYIWETGFSVLFLSVALVFRVSIASRPFPSFRYKPMRSKTGMKRGGNHSPISGNLRRGSRCIFTKERRSAISFLSNNWSRALEIVLGLEWKWVGCFYQTLDEQHSQFVWVGLSCHCILKDVFACLPSSDRLVWVWFSFVEIGNMWSFVLFIFICFVPHISVLFPSLTLGDGVGMKLLSYVGMFRIIFTLFIYNFPTSFFGRLTCIFAILGRVGRWRAGTCFIYCKRCFV